MISSNLSLVTICPNLKTVFEGVSMTDFIIYYFSGTGNSYYIAKELAKANNAILKPLISLKNTKSINCDTVGFVFPSYDFKPPKIVTQLIHELDTISCNYSFAVCTYGVALSKALYKFKKTLDEKHCQLNAGYGIIMPHNAVGSISLSDQINAERLLASEASIRAINHALTLRNQSTIKKTSLFENGSLLRMFPTLMKFLFKLITKGAKGLSFTVRDDCINCGQCQAICPTKNITMIDGKPTFGDDCSSCFACLQWCPVNAIHIGQYTFEEIYMKAYHHPKVSAQNLIQELNNSSK